jgi:hypothetical protein
MAVHSDELQRCESLIACATDSVESVTRMTEQPPGWPRPTLDALASLLEQGLAELAPMIAPSPDPPLAERLWELGEIEDGFETALAFHGWRLDEPQDGLPPVLTERLDDHP